MIQEPIILVGDGGAELFLTKGEAERYTEPIDIENGVYLAAYDALGRLLDLSVSEDGHKGCISMSGSPEDRSAELAETLRIMLSHIAEARQVSFNRYRLQEYPLERLIEISKGYASR